MRVLRFALVSTALALTMCVASLIDPKAPAAQAPFDPQSLVGEWSGTWARKDKPGQINGPYSLKIEKVQGDKVSGKTESRLGTARWTGVLEKDRLSFNGPEGVTTELSTDGKAMSGSLRSKRGVYDLSLTKK